MYVYCLTRLIIQVNLKKDFVNLILTMLFNMFPFYERFLNFRSILKSFTITKKKVADNNNPVVEKVSE